MSTPTPLPQAVQNMRRELDQLIQQSAAFFKSLQDEEIATGEKPKYFDEKFQDEWLKILCVRVSTYLEQAIKVIFKNYAESQRNSAPNFVMYFLMVEYGDKDERSKNATWNNMITLLGNLNRNWREKFIQKFNNTDSQLDLNAMLKQRNKIAHEGVFASSEALNLKDIERYFKTAEQIIQYLFDLTQETNRPQ